MNAMIKEKNEDQGATVARCEKRVVRLKWDDPKWWPARCPECGWEGMSDETEGGHQIADTGDYDNPVCPVCCHSDEGQYMGKWIPVEEIPNPA